MGAKGSGTISVVVTDINGAINTITVCVEILESPVADFSVSDTAVCLNTPISFYNNSVGASSFFWDFGDGNSSTMFQPIHNYSNPGTYTTILYVTNNNYDNAGNPLCCCTDTFALDIYVDSLEGPNIYWVSTLCANDSSKYWTDATNCTYNWTVLDENDSTIAFYGQGNDTICVQWGNGPVGTVILDAQNCDQDYCPFPVSVSIPIIPPTTDINGATIVCSNATQTYTVPKWLSVYYDWSVTNGTIVSGQGTNTITIHWDAGPGTGTINLNYASDFLSGLPDQNPDDCEGLGALTVDIKPDFEIFGPNPTIVCINTSSSFFANPSDPAGFTWSITPTVPFSGQGLSTISVNWTVAGNYIITAIPNDTTVFCIDQASTSITVIEVSPPDSITGPLEICPGELASYFGHSSMTDVSFEWTLTGGTPSTYTGNPLTVTWNSVGPYSISLQQKQLNAPNCISDPITLNINEISLIDSLFINGPDGCINTVQNYSGGPLQHPGANYSWSISPASSGSVVSGQGTLNIQIQWNNDPGLVMLTLSVELCDSVTTETVNLNLNAPVEPVIVQIGDLCPGVSAILDGGSGFSSYNWSTSDTTQTIIINSGGTYTLTTIDAGGCEATVSFDAVELPGPVADISTPDFTTLCITTPPNSDSVTIYAITNPGYSYQWFCNNVLQANTSPILVHNNTNVTGTFQYWAIVTNQDSCFSISDTITVVQSNCDGPPCNSENYDLSFSVNNQFPNCNVVDFTVLTNTNVSGLTWNFGETSNNTNSGTLLNAIHTYSKAGYYMAVLNGVVPELPPGSGNCAVKSFESVCIPLAADFNFNDSCLQVCFEDLSTFLPAIVISTWSWDFGDFNSSSSPSPCHTYTTGGTYTVTLTVTDATGCIATITKSVIVAGSPTIVTTISPNPACVGDPINFNATGTGIISWLWDFGDGSSNGAQNPFHTYLNDSSYIVHLTAVNAAGCATTVIDTVIINPLPVGDSIHYAPSLTICEGDSVVLTAPSGSGYTYSWTNGASTQSIVVYASGTFGVAITDVNNCQLVLDPVEVLVLPPPEAYITGNLYICDNGCVTLSGPNGSGYTYQWLDNTGSPIPFQTFQNINVCSFSLLPGYSLIVTDANGCSAVSDQVVVTLATSPNFIVNISPDSCEGSISTLTVTPVEPNVVYQWSNGDSGPTTNVIQAGTYTVIGTDTISGCSSSQTATINPLPDLCLVPSGCYEVCNPDTLCGPEGLTAYQWNMNGLPIAGANDQCLVVTASGSYSLTGTNEYGCSLTSDILILEVINCDSSECDQLEITSKIQQDSCCWSLSYNNNYGLIYGIMISTNDADLDFNLASLNPLLGIQTIGSNYLGLQSNPALQPIPSGSIFDFISFCFENVINDPQVLIIQWLDSTNMTVCSDTLIFECPVEPNCPYLANDSIYCDGDMITYDISICNPTDGEFEMGFVQITPQSPTGITVTPMSIDITANPILQGDCRTFTFVLDGNNIEGDTFCYSLSTHDFDPERVDTALCCTLDTIYCVLIPDCYPCDDIGVESVEELGSTARGGCCYQIDLFNNYDANYFDGINLCMLSPSTSMTINNPFGSGWVTSVYTTTNIELDVSPPLGNFIPSGVFQLPVLCIQTNAAPSQLLEIKWMIGDSIVCRDTVVFRCEPECAYITEEEIHCDQNGNWNFSGLIKNTSGFTMDDAHFVFTSPPGMSIYNQTVNLGALPTGNLAPFNLNLGPPANAGDTICFTVAMHELNDDSLHTNCCNFSDCIVLPECDPTTSVIDLNEYVIKVFPNPVSTELILNVEWMPEPKMDIQIFNLEGQLFRESKIYHGINTIHVADFPSGYYLLRIGTENKWFVKY